jgi:hypothetical protein
MRIVNGYVCTTCTDESLANRGVDPSKPKEGTAVSAVAQKKNNNLSEPVGADGQPVKFGVNAPVAAGVVGTQLSTYA